MRKSKSYPRNNWEQLPTGELDKILQAELRKEDPSREVVLPILEILEEREKDYPQIKEPEVLLEKETVRKKTSSRQFVRKYAWIAAVAAILCTLFMTLPPAAGADSLMDMLFRWTESVLELIKPDRSGNEPKITEEFTSEHPGLCQVYNTLSELGVTAEVVPTWLHTDFTLSEIKKTEVSANAKKINFVFTQYDGTAILSYRILATGNIMFEKENAGVEVYDYSNVEHYFIENEGKCSVRWSNGNVECSLSTNLPKEEVYRIIDSIYKRNLK